MLRAETVAKFVWIPNSWKFDPIRILRIWSFTRLNLLFLLSI